MKQYVLCVGVIWCIYPEIVAGRLYDQLHTLHKNIGRSLTSLRKDVPHAQQQIYKTLDNVGGMYRVACNAFEKKRTYKKRVAQEQELRLKLHKENQQLKQELDQTKHVAHAHEQQSRDVSRSIAQLEQEKNILQKQLDKQKQEFEHALHALSKDGEHKSSKKLLDETYTTTT